jgi:hypothetical protein
MNENLKLSERNIVRDLAKRIADIADEPVQKERIGLWKKHNSLQSARPMILIQPEGSWSELVPETALQCETTEFRKLERSFRQTIYAHDHFDSDDVVTRDFGVGKNISYSSLGLEAKWDHSDSTGSIGFHPVLHKSSDLKKLCMQEVTYNQDSTNKRLEQMQDLFGDILDVRLSGVNYIRFQPMQQYTALRGLNETMMDMAIEPEFVHDAMRIFTDIQKNNLKQYIDMNLLDLNNDNTYQNSGGNGWTDELPPPDYDPMYVRPKDMWAMAQAQELTLVSPEMHEEFALQYEKELLAPFGLTSYGCCEDLTKKLDYIFKIPNMRRISISPWADVDKCAEKLKGNYIFSWKPQPAHMVGNFNKDAIRKYIEHTVQVAKDNNCVLEIVLKDTHTCENHPERFDEWTRIAREVINAHI